MLDGTQRASEFYEHTSDNNAFVFSYFGTPRHRFGLPCIMTESQSESKLVSEVMKFRDTAAAVVFTCDYLAG